MKPVNGLFRRFHASTSLGTSGKKDAPIVEDTSASAGEKSTSSPSRSEKNSAASTATKLFPSKTSSPAFKNFAEDVLNAKILEHNKNKDPEEHHDKTENRSQEQPKFPFFLFRSPHFTSLKFEISVLYTFILGMILILFSVVLFFILDHTTGIERDQNLLLKAQEISYSIRAYLDIGNKTSGAFAYAVEKTIRGEGKSPAPWWRRTESRWLKLLPSQDTREEYLMNFVTINGKSILWSKNISISMLPYFVKAFQIPDQEGKAFKDVEYRHRLIRMINYLFMYNQHRYVIQVGVYVPPSSQSINNLATSVAISIPLILILTSFVGRLFAARILEPVEEITKTARRITYADLNARVKVRYFDTEMKELVEAFNDMITRLNKSFKHIEDFSSHVAHELKTPLAVIRGEAELALRKRREGGDYVRVIEIHLEEVKRMTKIIDDLLLLARVDYQPDVFHFETFDFSSFAREMYEQTKLLAVDKKIEITYQAPAEPFTINGDKLHLRRLFFNIIENALKFTPQEGRVDISVRKRDNLVLTAIADTGRGIHQQDLPNIFNKFFSIDDTKKGSGLGLSIAQSIARVHNGEILVDSQWTKGTTFVVILPLA